MFWCILGAEYRAQTTPPEFISKELLWGFFQEAYEAYITSPAKGIDEAFCAVMEGPIVAD